MVCHKNHLSPLCFDRPCASGTMGRAQGCYPASGPPRGDMCVGAKNQLSIPRAPCYTPLMYRLFANGPRATIEAAWDILAWSDPTPADAVDAKEDGRKGWTLDALSLIHI